MFQYQNGNRKNDNTIIKWNETTNKAWEECKNSLVQATLLVHPRSAAQLALKVDASNFAIGGVLEQEEDGDNWKPLAFYSTKLNTAQQKYSTYDRELLAAYLNIKHFKHLLQGRVFTLWTDHKPLIFAFKQKLDKCTPRQFRHLDYISQFTTDIRHISGKQNVTADILSRIEVINTNKINYMEIAKEQNNDKELLDLMNGNSSLKLDKVSIPGTDVTLICDSSMDSERPYIPVTHRKLVFEMLHNLSHPGVKTTTKLIKEKFIWPNINKDVAQWTKTCIPCQMSKINRHVKSVPGTFLTPSERFRNIHIDIVGPLPQCQGYRYCLTCIDRYTRWPEVVPMKDITAETVANSLYAGWITRFGVPETITTDQGTQFESTVFTATTKLLGVKRVRTTAFHPQTNGIIERFHRQLKTAIKCYKSDNWVDILPSVLLGIRSSLKEDIESTSAELVYGCKLRLPGEFIAPNKMYEDPISYAAKLRQWLSQVRPVPTSAHDKKKVFVYKDLKNSEFVFLRKDRVKKPLEQPYEGPFKVLERTEKIFTLKLNNKIKKVSIDRVKPAYLEANIQSDPEQKTSNIPSQITTTEEDDRNEEHRKDQKTSRRGRRIQLPVRFKD